MHRHGQPSGRSISQQENNMTSLAFDRSGTGVPLVLLHGLGSSRRAWDPVMAALAEHFDVIAVDLPGFGDSGPLPAQDEPLPAALAVAVAEVLDDLGVITAHVAGNSLGGWVALELAAIRPVASLALLSPAGLWRGNVPLYNRVSLRASRWLSWRAAGLLSRLVSYRLGRALVLSQTHGRPTQLTPDYARLVITTMSASPGFDATMRATATRRYLATAPITAPVTVAFGSRDRLLLRHQSRHLDQLPPGTRVHVLPGCGHVPMADDPDAVTAVITQSAARTTACAGRVAPGMGCGRRQPA
jgi:pimeloyl-ACP methyl ester carboxylesterase